MVAWQALPSMPGMSLKAYRLVNSKFPPIALFDDVADADAFELLYQLQALTNPRLQNEVGQLEHIPRGEIPFGIPGCSYAAAPFTHVNPTGSRFSDGRFGVLYLADTLETSLAEVLHHQRLYWSKVHGLHYDRFTFRGLCCTFNDGQMLDACQLAPDNPIYSPDDYSHSRRLGASIRQQGLPGLRYHSVRAPGHCCWALMTPSPVLSVVQAAHYEMVWNSGIAGANRLSAH